MLKSLSARNRTALDIVNVVAGLGLALSPWYIGFAADTYAAWNAWIVGAVIALIAIVALVTFHQAEEWANVVLGIWAAVAPWAPGRDRNIRPLPREGRASRCPRRDRCSSAHAP